MRRQFARSSVTVKSVAALLTLVLSLGSVAPVAAQASRRNPQTPITWGTCYELPDLPEDTGLECGKLSVPLDYGHPNGEKIDISVSRLPSKKPSNKRGILLSNPGGPGGPGLDMPLLLESIMPQDVIDSYDLIGFDPRFIGTSTPITCGLSAVKADQAFIMLTQENSFDKTATFSKQVAQDCAAKSGDKLAHATTANTARDMDMIRKALGEPKLSYLGYSYGTYLGAVYASLFKQQSDRMVLDSNVDPTGVWRQQFRDWGKAGEIRFPDFAHYLVANNDVFNLGADEKEINNKFYQLTAGLDKNPYVFEDGTVFNGALFRRVTFGTLYSDLTFAYGAMVWADVDNYISQPTPERGAQLKLHLAHLEGSTTSEEATDVPIDNAAAGGLAIACGDTTWLRNPSVYKRDLQSDIAKYPMFGELGSNITPCAFWQQHNNRPVELSSTGKRNILLVQNRRDPATPYFSGQHMRKALDKRARMVSVDQGGHAVSFIQDNTCANDIVSNYLLRGDMPKVDTDCADETQPEQAVSASTLRAKATNDAVDTKKKAQQEFVRRLTP